MSQTAPETPAPARTAPARGGTGAGGFFSRKIGPLPVWGYTVIGAVGGLGYLWWRKRKTAAGATTAATGTTGSIASALGTLQSEIQQLQGQPSGTASGGAGTGGGSPGGGTTAGGGVTATPITGKTTKPPGTQAGKTPPPTNLRADPAITTAFISWNKAKGATQYNVSRDGRGSAILPGTSDTHTFTGLKPATSHSFKITAYSPAGGYSEPAMSSFTTKASAAKKAGPVKKK